MTMKNFTKQKMIYTKNRTSGTPKKITKKLVSYPIGMLPVRKNS